MTSLASTVWTNSAPAFAPEAPAYDGYWDAGEMGCGELVMDLRLVLRAAPGKVLKLVARDLGALSDIPAYCRLTGNTLLHVSPEQAAFWIRAKE